MARITNPGTIQAVPMSFYPTMGNLNEAAAYAYSRLPILDRSELFSVLAVWQNTLIQEMQKQSPNI